MPNLHQWETVNRETGSDRSGPLKGAFTSVTRMKVPGGWLYVHFRFRRIWFGIDERHSMVFIPDIAASGSN